MVGVIVLLLWLLPVPVIVGKIAGVALKVHKNNLIFLWVTGQMMLWAGFQFICVPLILKAQPFSVLVSFYFIITGALLCVGLLIAVKTLKNDRGQWRMAEEGLAPRGKWYLVLWAGFWLLLLFQLFQAVFMTYGDGDDAFYVAVSTIAEESNTMYQKLPYTGGTTGLDIRHGLAPFPIWIAFLARISGIRTVSVAHVAVPLMLIPMTYGIYYLIGKKICRKNREKLPLFLIFTELLVLFGDYSLYSAENFMIARSRQGKAALGSIVIPFILYLYLLILERVQENRKLEWVLWLLLLASVFVGCMCSTLGAVLLCMVIGVTGICAALSYKKWQFLIPMAFCCVPAVCYAILYILAE